MLLRYQSLLRGVFCAVVALFFVILPAAAADKAAPKDEVNLQKTIHDYLVSHPDRLPNVIGIVQEEIDSISALQTRNVVQERKKDLFENPDDLVEGNPKGDVTLVEFFDYRCPYCKQVAPSLDALLKEDPKVRIVYKEWPILGPASVFASRVALASKKQGKYPAFHHAMMAMKGDINDETILKLAASVGLDIKRLQTDVSSPDVERVLKTNGDLADALKIDGTPGFILGDSIIPGAVDLDALRKNIAEQRKRG